MIRGHSTRAADVSGGPERGLRMYAHGLGLHGVNVGRLGAAEVGRSGAAVAARRAAITKDAILLPRLMPSPSSPLFGEAIVAHAIGHLRFSEPARPVGAWVPMAVAVMSLIEDTRVERLMMRDFPGLRGLWSCFYRMEGDPSAKGQTFSAFAERLALALHDPDYRDPHHWVDKGRSLIDAIGNDLLNVVRFNEVASILASDLGQMRVPFDPQSYEVIPAFRDDNTFLWCFDDPNPVQAFVKANGEQATGVEQSQQDAGSGEAEAKASRSLEAVVVLYPEWNYKAGVIREDWVSVVDSRPLNFGMAGSHEVAPRNRHVPVRVRYRQTFSPRRVRRQREGDELDLEALVSHFVTQRRGEDPDGHVFSRLGRRPRPVSVLLLLDLSLSTARTVDGTELTLLDCERNAAELAIELFDGESSRIAVHGFASNGRTEVRYLRMKDFGAKFDEAHRLALQRLQPAWSTRIGAALRHGGSLLEHEENQSKSIIMVTDGQPSDIDVFDEQYLVEDAKKAVDMLAARGIRTQCICVEPGAHDVISRIFGRRNCLSVGRSTRLSGVLPDLLARTVA